MYLLAATEVKDIYETDLRSTNYFYGIVFPPPPPPPPQRRH